MEFPTQFADMMMSLPGHAVVLKALADEESPVAIRLNPYKPLLTPDSFSTKVPWEPNGYYLPQRPRFTFHPGLYDGSFYVQDPSAMITGEVLRRIVGDSTVPVNYLDACAAPGGKTTSAMAVLPPGSFVLANEYALDRVTALIENLERWGIPGYAVSRADARDLACLGSVFDIVSADVPCSGEGMMRKNSIALSQWSPGLVESCAELQRNIVEAVWQTLRPGGYLIYSTCTFNRIENELNAEWIRDSLDAIPVDLGLSDLPGVTPGVDTTIPCARFVPGNIRGEGQFVAVFRKPSDSPAVSSPKHRPLKTVAIPPILAEGYVGVTDKNGDIYALNRSHLDMLSLLASKINIVTPGVHIFSSKGSDFRPAPALASSLLLKDGSFPVIDVDYRTAMAFLRGEALRLETDTPRGYILVSNNGHRLGWVKNVGSRANNLVPPSRRIRSSYIPESIPVLFAET
ncbi:MAG: hypothetical protein J1F20_06295 [Muribaculaceae bacterium]|nr:hypothetical protein [Muribaculaceae bacterium]